MSLLLCSSVSSVSSLAAFASSSRSVASRSFVSSTATTARTTTKSLQRGRRRLPNTLYDYTKREGIILSKGRRGKSSTAAQFEGATARTTAGTAAASSSTPKNKSLLMQMLDWYSRQLDTHPLLTKAITGGLIASAGDGLCQSVIEVYPDGSTKPFDYVRNACFSLVGAAYIAPGIHVWYNFLATRLAPGTSAMAVAKRVAWDQFVFAPPFIAGLLSSLWYLEHVTTATAETTTAATQKKKDDEDDNSSDKNNIIAVIGHRLKTTLPDIVQANWILWIPANFFNFGFVAVKYQVLFNNSLGLVWNAYLSFTSSQAQQPPAQQVVKRHTKSSVGDFVVAVAERRDSTGVNDSHVKEQK